MAELADAPDLGSGVHDVQVQVLLPAVKDHMILFRRCGLLISFLWDFFIEKGACRNIHNKLLL